MKMSSAVTVWIIIFCSIFVAANKFALAQTIKIEDKSDLIQKVFIELIETANRDTTLIIDNVAKAKKAAGSAVGAKARFSDTKILSLKSVPIVKFTTPDSTIKLIKAAQAVQKFGLLDKNGQLLKTAQVYSSAVPLPTQTTGSENTYLAVSVFSGFNDGNRRLLMYVTPSYDAKGLSSVKIGTVSSIDNADLPRLATTAKEVNASNVLGRILIAGLLNKNTLSEIEQSVKKELGYNLTTTVSPERIAFLQDQVSKASALINDKKSLAVSEPVKITKNDGDQRWLVINGYEKIISAQRKQTAILLLGFNFSTASHSSAGSAVGSTSVHQSADINVTLNNINFQFQEAVNAKAQ